ncbi:hypothetical protein BRARA_G00801 [Brassica rapa]|uniref:Replication factor A C-terminal domain-containing protein n=1 Tax=Brassica campestris TaxID=3711 RepID=A0A397YIW8_BRACM|nr:hypothetical protein BRARA_G00801 [Brassica rapa]
MTNNICIFEIRIIYPINYNAGYLYLNTTSASKILFDDPINAINDFKQRSGWNYISCDKCKKKLKKDGNTLVCETCPHQDITVILLKRYRVELIVDDGSDTVSFVMFNKDLTKILNKSPVELIDHILMNQFNIYETINNVETEENAIVSFLNENLVGEEFIFTIRINSYNFRSTSSGITIIETHRKDSATNSVL